MWPRSCTQEVAEFRLEIHPEGNVHLLYHFSSLFCFHCLNFISFLFTFSTSHSRTRSWMMMGWVKPSLVVVKWHLIVTLIFISLMINDVDFFLCYCPFVYILWRKSIQSLCSFFWFMGFSVLFLSFCC